MKRKLLTLFLTLSTLLTLLAPAAAATQEITSYSQSQGDWSSYSYGYRNAARTIPATISSSGCGLLSLTNAIYYLNGNFIDPELLADYAVANGYRINGVGTDSGLYQSFAEAHGAEYGFSYVEKVTDYTSLQQYLSQDYVAICGKSGHIMALVDYNADTDQYLLLDSVPSSARGTTSGYAWKTQSQLSAIGIYRSFHILGDRSTGWQQDDQGNWYYYDADGTPWTGWRLEDSGSYYLTDSGIMATGFQEIDGLTYYFAEDGTMQTGWLILKDGTYYLTSSGVMIQSRTITLEGETYTFGPEGKLVE